MGTATKGSHQKNGYILMTACAFAGTIYALFHTEHATVGAARERQLQNKGVGITGIYLVSQNYLLTDINAGWI
jgi:hypothetical protein